MVAAPLPRRLLRARHRVLRRPVARLTQTRPRRPKPLTRRSRRPFGKTAPLPRRLQQARQLAGLQLKNALYAKSRARRKISEDRWLGLEEKIPGRRFAQCAGLRSARHCAMRFNARALRNALRAHRKAASS